jgi:hypothetical protein
VFFNPNTPPLVVTDGAGTGLASSNNAFYRSLVDPIGNVQQTGTGLVLFSGVNAIAVASNTDWQAASTGSSSNALQIPAEFTQGYYRVIGAAFEVTNTTAELYKGGTVTVYRSPAFSCRGSLQTITGPYETSLVSTTVTTPVTQVNSSGVVKILETTETKSSLFPQWYYVNIPCDYQNLPPSTQSAAALYPNSRTWGATDGCYIVMTMNSEANPFVAPVSGKTSGLLLGIDNNTLTTGDGNRTAWLPRWGGAGGPTFRTPGLSSNIPFDISGAVFAGLNSNTTLQVTAKYFVERLPAISDKNLLVLARNPCPYDPMILELYSRAILSLPVGVKVGENPLGEWFFDILQALAGAAPAIGAAFGPIGAGIGTAIGVGGTAALQARKAAKQQPPKKKG